jgi:hypothetical protein
MEFKGERDERLDYLVMPMDGLLGFALILFIMLFCNNTDIEILFIAGANISTKNLKQRVTSLYK